MPKKLKVENCLDCGYYSMHPTKQEIVCNHPDFAYARTVDTPLIVKAKNIIPEWCPLEEWEE